jgi:hypothetical protein
VKIRSHSDWRRALPAAGLVALAAYLFVSGFLGLGTAWARIRSATSDARDDAFEALAKQRRREYADAIARIRQVLPPDSEYLLIDYGIPTSFARFDLAPRRAVFGGSAADVAKNITPENLASLPRWTVVPSFDVKGPRLVETRLIAETGKLP